MTSERRDSNPTVLITGGLGFVASNVALALLRASTTTRIVIADVAAPTALTEAWFSGYEDRIMFRRVDILNLDDLTHLPERQEVSHVIHAAAITLVAEWERATPRRYLDINLTGTLNVVEWFRGLPQAERFIYFSTGGVYGEPTENTTDRPQEEDDLRNPTELYSMAKAAAEDVVSRYSELFGISLGIVRPSAVFGPMERPTAFRKSMSLPYVVAKAIVRRTPMLVSARSLEAGGDYISAEDVGQAIRTLVFKATENRVYNLASGRFIAVREVLELAARLSPAFTYRVVEEPEVADVDLDPANRLGCWNAYSVRRARADLGWKPRPIQEQLESYVAWAAGIGELLPWE